MKIIVGLIAGCLLVTLAGTAYGVDCDLQVTFDGKGAGQVIFNGATHAGKGIACSECHERRGLSLPLFEKKKGSTAISMRKMEMGRACGHCHDVTDYSKCSKCHQK